MKPPRSGEPDKSVTGVIDVTDPAPRLLTPLTYRVAQVAAMLNVPKSTLYEWVRTGEIESVRVGSGKRKLLLIPATAVDEFLQRNKRPTRAGP